MFVRDSNGRPVQVSVWYPAQATGPCAGVSFDGDVDVDVVVPPPLADFASAMRLLTTGFGCDPTRMRAAGAVAGPCL